LNETVAQMMATIDVQDRKSKLRTYKRCFVASEAVDWLVKTSRCANRTEAVDLCCKLHRKGAFRHVINPDQVFFDKELFFRWAEHDDPFGVNTPQTPQRSNPRSRDVVKESAPSLSASPHPQALLATTGGDEGRGLEGLEGLAEMLDWQVVLADMKQYVPVRDRSHALFQRYKRCFVASEAVDWLVGEAHCATREDAVAMCQRLYSLGAIRHVVNPDQPFLDEKLFFRWAEHEGIEEDDDDEELAFPMSLMSLHRADTSMEEAARDLDIEKERHVEVTKIVMGELGWVRVLAPPLMVLLMVHAMAMGAGRLPEPAVWALTLATVVAMLFKFRQLLLGSEKRVVVSAIKKAGPSSHADDGLHIARGGVVLEPAEVRRVVRLRATLYTTYPEVLELYTDAYLHAVLSAPDPKINPHHPRTFLQARDKLLAALECRRGSEVASLAPSDVATNFGAGSVYWHGFDPEGQPVVWFHPARKDWAHLDADREIDMHVLLLEYGIKMMPPGVTTFVVVVNTSGVGAHHSNKGLREKLVEIIAAAYPDRVSNIYVGPVNFLVRTIMSVILPPILPAGVAEKIVIMHNPRQQLAAVLGGSDKVPAVFGGPVDHKLADVSGVFQWERMETAMQEMAREYAEQDAMNAELVAVEAKQVAEFAREEAKEAVRVVRSRRESLGGAEAAQAEDKAALKEARNARNEAERAEKIAEKKAAKAAKARELVEKAELAKLKKILDKEEKRIKKALEKENIRQAKAERRSRRQSASNGGVEETKDSGAEQPVVTFSDEQAENGHPTYDASSFDDEM